MLWGDALELGGDAVRYAADAHWLGTLDAHDQVIGFPPLHLHHLHLRPCARSGAYCRNDGLRIVVQHGDWVFPGGSAESYGQIYDDRVKLLPTSMSVDAEINDVRPEGAPSLEWHLQIGLRLNERQVDPVSLHRVHGPVGSCALQSCDVYPFTVPRSDSFSMYVAVWPSGGQLVGATFHAHMTLFQHTLLCSITLSELLQHMGLPAIQTATILTSHHGFASNAHMITAAHERIPNTTVICSASRHVEQIRGVAYDRAAYIRCRNHTRFERGDTWTGISFNAAERPASDALSLQHNIWYLLHTSDYGTSLYTQTMVQDIFRPLSISSDRLRHGFDLLCSVVAAGVIAVSHVRPALF